MKLLKENNQNEINIMKLNWSIEMFKKHGKLYFKNNENTLNFQTIEKSSEPKVSVETDKNLILIKNHFLNLHTKTIWAKIQKYENKLIKDKKRQQSLNIKIKNNNFTKSNLKFTGIAFITFDTVIIRRTANHYINPPFYIWFLTSWLKPCPKCRKKFFLIKYKGYNLEACDAPLPSDIIWENLGYSYWYNFSLTILFSF